MDKLRFGFRLGPKADISPPGLEIGEITTGGNFQIAFDARSPGFEIVTHCSGKAQIAAAQLEDTIWQTQQLQ